MTPTGAAPFFGLAAFLDGNGDDDDIVDETRYLFKKNVEKNLNVVSFGELKSRPFMMC
jgi:hypothetical protein